jgi:BON domain
MKSSTSLRITAFLAATAASMALAQGNTPSQQSNQSSQQLTQPPAQGIGQNNAPAPAANAAMTTAGSADARPDVTSQAVSTSGRKQAPSPAMPFVQEPIATATRARGTDAQLGDAIVKALDADPSLKDSKITVQPENGKVTLTGATLTRAQKQRAGEIAMAQAGQGKVVNIILDDES